MQALQGQGTAGETQPSLILPLPTSTSIPYLANPVQMVGVTARRPSGELALLLMKSQRCLGADARPILKQNSNAKAMTRGLG